MEINKGRILYLLFNTIQILFPILILIDIK